MTTALDSDILSAVWSNESNAGAITKKLQIAREQGSLVLSPVALAELFAHPRVNEAGIFSRLDSHGVRVDFQLKNDVWIEAGRRYSKYADRRRKSFGEQPKRLLADFIVGAHALLEADRLMTLDVERYSRDFSELRLMLVEEQA